MNGGRPTRVTSRPVEGAEHDAHGGAEQERQHARYAVLVGNLGDDEVGQQHRRADGEVDACGQDDEGLANGQGGHHCGLLQDDAHRLGPLHPAVPEEDEHDVRQHQHDQRTDDRRPVQDVLDSVGAGCSCVRTATPLRRRRRQRSCKPPGAPARRARVVEKEKQRRAAAASRPSERRLQRTGGSSDDIARPGPVR